MEIVVSQNVCEVYIIVTVAQDIGQCTVPFIILSGLDLDRNDFPVLSDDKIQFTLFLAVEVMQLVVISSETVAMQLLGDEVFIYGTVILLYLSLKQLQLDSGSILTSQESYVILEQFEQIPQFIQFE